MRMAPLTRARVLLLLALAVEVVVLRGHAWPVVIATLAVAAGVITWGIAAPAAQLVVPSVNHTRASDAIAFTFDDGPDPATTPRVLDLLALHAAHATFFVVGSRAAAHPEIVRRIVAEGHDVGSHTWSHAHTFHFGSAARQRLDIERGLDAVAAITGQRPRLFRPPQGLRTPPLRRALAGLSLVCVTWSERALDAMGRDSRAIVRRLDPAVRAGAILALHDGGGFGGTLDRSPTVAALGTLLDLARARGLRCVRLEEVLT